MKFSYKIGSQKLSVTYYQETQRNALRGLKKQTHPIYFTIIFNKETIRVRSILWKRLVESNNQFVYGVTFQDGKRHSIIEGCADIENGFIKNKQAYHNLCEYEFECLKRIITFALQEKPKNVSAIVAAYNHWGTDGLREVASIIIKKIIGDPSSEMRGLSKGISVMPYRSPSLNTRVIISQLLEGGQDPVSIISFLNESGVLDRQGTKVPASLNQGFRDVVALVLDLAFAAVYSIDDDHKHPLGQSRLPGFGIYYFPRIHFFYPISNDLSVNGTVNLLQRLLKFIPR